MKKVIFILLFLLTAATMWAQYQETHVKITGVGEFYIGMENSNIESALKYHETDSTSLDDLGKAVILRNIKLAGILFEVCIIQIEDSNTTLAF